jgi:hypothetical protein
MNRPSSFFAVAFLVAFAGVGCFPIPHTEIDAPEVEGVARRDGHPLVGATVHRRTSQTKGPRDAFCVGGDTTTTDDQGRFRIEKVDHREPYVYFGDKWSVWHLSFEIAPGECATWESMDTAPEKVDVACELPSPPLGAKQVELQDLRRRGAAGSIGCRTLGPR